MTASPMQTSRRHKIDISASQLRSFHTHQPLPCVRVRERTSHVLRPVSNLDRAANRLRPEPHSPLWDMRTPR